MNERESARPLAWSRIALGGLFLLRTTPLLAPLHLPFTLGTYPLLGWPSSGWHGAPVSLAAAPSLVAAACVLRTVSGFCFMIGYRTSLFGVLAGASGYFVLFQDPFGFNATIHLLLQGAFLLALTDAGSALAVRPAPVRNPASSKLLVRAFLASIYFWAGFVKLRRDWFDGRTLALFQKNGAISGVFSDFLLHAAWSRSLVACTIVTTELSLPVLLLWRKSRRFAPLLALALHASIELAAHPDLLGWEMAALLLCLLPLDAACESA
ncbi:MAG TPA: HTTM domain-containing protein [Polyangiaceae bacterium]|jgi:hypothetical protein